MRNYNDFWKTEKESETGRVQGQEPILPLTPGVPECVFSFPESQFSHLWNEAFQQVDS